MNAYNPYNKLVLIFLAASLLFVGCEKEPDPDPNPDPDLPEEILVLNNWIWEGMNDFYLWEEFLPNLNPNYEEDPQDFFYKLLYIDDNDSWITDDYQSLINMFEGVELATGMSASPGLIDEDRVISIIEYVTPFTPAADSGIKRGDVIVTIDGQFLTRDNYFGLYRQTTATFGFGSYDGMNPVPNGREITLTAQELNLNPFIHHEVIDYEGYKIGYVVYTGFVPGPNGEWLDEMDVVFGSFKDAGVSDVVIDVRYNGGGYGFVTEKLASILGPESAVSNNSVFSRQFWNNDFTQYWKDADLDQDGKADGDESSQLLSRFPDTDLNLNMSSLYFLTTGRSASASELIMVGLYPYAEVVQIGTTTYGKCYGSVTIDDWETPKRHNWAMQPIVQKVANADGYTDYVNGLDPDHEVEDFLLTAEPFGSLDDPLLGKALELISGVTPVTKKSVERQWQFDEIPVPRKPIPELKLDQLPTFK